MRRLLNSLLACAVALALCAGTVWHSATVSAQAPAPATVFGYLSNFDVVNHTEQETHGFEIELEGLQPADIYYSFGGTRYGVASVIPYATGVRVRWQSAFNPNTQQFDMTTIAHAPNTPFAGQCYSWQPGYATSGCEHFGVSTRANATATTYRWLVADTQTPGALVPFDPPVPIPVPVWTVAPPPVVGNPPIIVAEVNAPETPRPVAQYGDAQWVKVFKTELPREVGLDELMSDNAVVPQDPAQVEVSWDILQAPPANANGKHRQRRNQGALSNGSRAVVRRYEYYQYTGAYDPATHEVVCGGDGTCNAPQDGELGDVIGAQMAAVNVGVPSVTVATVGKGSVSSADRVISCGNRCTESVNNGASVTLTASAASGYVFAGWSGACDGNQPTCTLSVNDQLNVTATFKQQFTLSVSRGSGTVTSTQPGIDCGKTCSGKFAQGTTLTLNAAPAAGQRFTGWTGACSGIAPTCNVTITKDTQVQANFAK
jgi:uncharacterized repeat protein (TIGR02543 family)